MAEDAVGSGGRTLYSAPIVLKMTMANMETTMLFPRRSH